MTVRFLVVSLKNKGGWWHRRLTFAEMSWPVLSMMLMLYNWVAAVRLSWVIDYKGTCKCDTGYTT